MASARARTRHVRTTAKPRLGYDPNKAAPAGAIVRSAAYGARCCVSDLLLHRVSRGDDAAVRECIARFGGLVWTLARRAGLKDAEAEDAVQEVFAELWRSGARYDPAIASETAFIATIARRRLIDRRRRATRHAGASPIVDDEQISAPQPPPPPVDSSDEATKAARALCTLSHDQQRVLRLAVYEGLSHELISRATGLPLGTVKTHARRGLMRLRELLGHASAGDEPRGGT